MQDGAESMRDELSKMMSFLFVCFLFCCCCLVEGELGGLRQEMDFTAFWLVVLHTVSTLFSSPFFTLPFTRSTLVDLDFLLKASNLFLTIVETHVEDEEGLYDCVYGEDEGGEVYEDLMKAEEAQQSKCPENDIRSCCLAEIKQTEEKYTETLESIEKYFMAPLKRFLTAAEFDSVFINIPELVKVHRNLMQEIHDSIVNKNDQNLYQVFINYKERLVIYGQYCSGVESAISSLDYISKTKEDVKLKLEECSKRANNGKFTLRDLLVVPMQRVLKYHLLLQELVKHTTDPMEKANLKLALDAMKDLAQYVNEVKRDNETLREIKQFQLSIENLNQPVLLFGRPQGDGEIRITTLDKHTKQERHIFLFDLAVIVCKRKGDNYEMKEIIDLQQYKIANNPTTDKENKKWSHGFYLIHIQGQNGLEFYCKTKDLKKKWLEQFEMALDLGGSLPPLQHTNRVRKQNRNKCSPGPSVHGDSPDKNGIFPTQGLNPGNGDPLQYSCLENSMDRGTWWATLGWKTVSKSGAFHSTLDIFIAKGVVRTLQSLLQHHSSKASILRHSAFFTVQLSHPYMTTGKTIALSRWTFVGKLMSLLFNMLPRLVITFLLRSKQNPKSQWF
ncbi:hypothetical protein FD754_000520 [Muntiacus muntjak]|uniref:DH domain-containing protein n=1 Tax=Muntiacus muntjak TaxID=9888 RepID=A0A5N3W4E3_MUNMU|nr:hypothetical protein FD754_000520 [Muntiacus muntjak]